jgi:N-acetylneuraminate synthase
MNKLNSKVPAFAIGERRVGREFNPLVVVEIGINHGGSLVEAKKLVDAAVKSGAEIIKHQTHIPDKEMSREAKHVVPGNSNKSIYEIISETALTLDEEVELSEYVSKLGLIYISTPFSFEAADFLESLDVPAFKIGSGECNNYVFVEHIAKKGKPIILSTGMNSIDTIKPAVDVIRSYGLPFALLHCTNLYPTPSNLIRLNAIRELEEFFPDAVLGLSDHSTSNFPCLGAVALGASILERHFTDSMLREGPDISCSMDPENLKGLIEGSKTIYIASTGNKRPVDEEGVTSAFAFASIVSNAELKIGDIIHQDNIALRRPHGGDFGPTDYYRIIGSRVLKPIQENTQIKNEDIQLKL